MIRPLRFGLCLPQFTGDGRAVLRSAGEAEDDGYDLVSLFDHLAALGGPPTRPVLECLTTLAAVAGMTTRVTVLPLVLRASLRPAATVAAIVRTLELAAPGRVVCALGAGDRFNAAEDASVGLPALGPADRVNMLAETVTAVRGGAPGVPVWLGGSGPKISRLAGELADGWNIWAATPQLVAERAAQAFAAAAAAGRPAPEISWGGQVLLAPSDAEADHRLAAWGAGRTPAQLAGVLHGSPEAVMARLRGLSAAGASTFLLSFVGEGAQQARRIFARDAAPYLRAERRV